MNKNSHFTRMYVFLFLIGFTAIIQTNAQEKKLTENEKIIKKLYEAVNAKDLDYIRSLGDPASEWLDVPFNVTTKGVNAIHDPWKSWFDIFPDATCEVQSLVGMGDYVIARGKGRGTHKGVFHSPAGVLEPRGASLETDFCDVYRLKNGKIIRADSYFDFYLVLSQLAPEKVK